MGIEKTVTISLDEFSDVEIEEEYNYRDLGDPDDNLKSCSDEDLLEEYSFRGYKNQEESMLEEIAELKTTYLTMSPEFFNKKLKEFFGIQ